MKRGAGESEICLTPQLVGGGQHIVGGLDGFGVHFIRTLGGDHAHHFLNDLHIGHFQDALCQRAEAFLTWCAVGRSTRRRRFAEVVAADVL